MTSGNNFSSDGFNRGSKRVWTAPAITRLDIDRTEHNTGGTNEKTKGGGGVCKVAYNGSTISTNAGCPLEKAGS